MLISLVVQAAAGALGGNLAALWRRGGTHGVPVNMLLGAVGGVAGGTLLSSAIAPGVIGDGLAALLSGMLLSFGLGLLRKRQAAPTGP